METLNPSLLCDLDCRYLDDVTACLAVCAREILDSKAVEKYHQED